MKLHANGRLDAVIGVVSRARSRLQPGSVPPDRLHGNATIAFRASHSSSYFIVVGQQQGSRAGTFSLSGLAAAAPEKFPGRQLPAHAVRATLNGLTNVNDVWNTKLTAGTTYRVAFTSPACARAELLRPKDNAVLLSFNCSGYRTFTPGPDGGGRYILEVLAAPSDRSQPYRLQFAAVEPDDIGVGIPIANQTVHPGSLDPRGVDVVDIYHFDVDRRSDVGLTLCALRHRVPPDAGDRRRQPTRRRHGAGTTRARTGPLRRRGDGAARDEGRCVSAGVARPRHHGDDADARNPGRPATQRGRAAADSRTGFDRDRRDSDRPVRSARGLAVQPHHPHPGRQLCDVAASFGGELA